MWNVLLSTNTNTPLQQQWGTAGDIPVQGDYDADGRTDFVIWRPSVQSAFLLLRAQSQGFVVPLGVTGDSLIYNQPALAGAVPDARVTGSRAVVIKNKVWSRATKAK
jgi:hypothetical protein